MNQAAIRIRDIDTANHDVSSMHPAPVMTLRPTSRGKIVGDDPKVRGILEMIDRVAHTACTVLITGESGTGKELVVAALHDASDRRAAPLVTVNCGAIPADLVESELFGHVRGAFTGAHSGRRGVVAAAEGGTLFLDEVGELPLSAQVKFLRLLQQREYTPVGETRPVRCDVRIVAATHRCLEDEVRAGRFREDLYYRLNVINVRVPALRERSSDVPLLAKHFYRAAVERCSRKDLRGFSEDALRAIAENPWPGNVRALENAVERAVLLSRGPLIEADDIISPTSPTLREVTPIGIVTPITPTTPIEPAAPPTRAHDFPATTLPSPSFTTPLGASAPIRANNSNPGFPRVLPDQGVDLTDATANYQANLIRQALNRTGGNKNRAAQLLSMNRTTLVEIIRRRHLSPG